MFGGGDAALMIRDGDVMSAAAGVMMTKDISSDRTKNNNAYEVAIIILFFAFVWTTSLKSTIASNRALLVYVSLPAAPPLRCFPYLLGTHTKIRAPGCQKPSSRLQVVSIRRSILVLWMRRRVIYVPALVANIIPTHS